MPVYAEPELRRSAAGATGVCAGRCCEAPRRLRRRRPERRRLRALPRAGFRPPEVALRRLAACGLAGRPLELDLQLARAARPCRAPPRARTRPSPGTSSASRIPSCCTSISPASSPSAMRRSSAAASARVPALPHANSAISRSFRPPASAQPADAATVSGHTAPDAPFAGAGARFASLEAGHAAPPPPHSSRASPRSCSSSCPPRRRRSS